MRIQFDIAKAQAGAKVVTRDGRTVRIVAYDMENIYPICAIIRSQEGTEYPEVYLKNGCYDEDEIENDCDLFIEEESTYRPYANADEMDEAIKEHGHGMYVVNRLTDVRQAIIAYSNLEVATSATKQSYKAFLNSHTWLDGTPCGVQEGGEDE